MSTMLLLLIAGFTTGLSGAMVPGPLSLYVVSAAFEQGRWVGVKIAIGHLLLEAGFVALVVLGFRDGLSSMAFRVLVAWVGGLGLVVMGGLILAKVRSLSLVKNAHVVFHWGPIAGGAVFSLMSPGFLIWWATIGASVLLQGLLAGPAGLIMVSIGHAAADLLWCWFLAFSIERGKAYCTDHVYRVIMAVIAVCLIVLGIGLPLKTFVTT